jgi:MFS family permease
MGLVLGAFWLAYGLFEMPGGWMGDRFGARKTLTRIVLAWSLFTMLTGSATGLMSLLVFRFLFGVGEAGAYPNVARVQAHWLPVRVQARAGGLIWLLARWGAAFSPFLFGRMLRSFDSAGFRDLLITLGLSGTTPAWRVAFWAAGLIGVGWCIAFYPWFRDNPADMRSVNSAELRLIQTGENPTTTVQHSLATPWRALLASRSLWAIGILYVFGSFGWSFLISWMPRYLEEVHQVTFEDSEVMTGLPFFCGGISCLLGGALSDAFVRRTGRKWLGRAVFPICGYTTAAVAMFCVRFATSPEQAAVLICLASAGNDFGQGANWASIVDIGGRHAGTATGFINMVGNMGNSLQPYFGALIFRNLGWNVLMSTYAATFLAAASMWLFIRPERTFYAEPPAAKS